MSIVGVCFGWALFEYMNGAAGWAVLFVLLGGYALHQFFLDGWPEKDSDIP